MIGRWWVTGRIVTNGFLIPEVVESLPCCRVPVRVSRPVSQASLGVQPAAFSRGRGARHVDCGFYPKKSSVLESARAAC